VLPSYHEGLPISLLEAISYKLPVLISDIPPHREIGLPESRYFKCRNINDLKCKIEIFLNSSGSSEEVEKYFQIIKEKYNWDNIAKQTINVYYKMLEDKNGHY
jgi:glycosyltransferase involved in cell wall biosynthesis